MSAALRWNENRVLNTHHAKLHLEMIIELLREVDMEKRMMAIIEVSELRDDLESATVDTTGIKAYLDEEFHKVQKMLFMLEQMQN